LATFHLSNLLLVLRTDKLPNTSPRRESCWWALLDETERATANAGGCLRTGPQHTIRAVVEKAILANSTAAYDVSVRRQPEANFGVLEKAQSALQNQVANAIAPVRLC
jgi:hypothetical protein